MAFDLTKTARVEKRMPPFYSSLRHRALNLFRHCPNETGEDHISGRVLKEILDSGLILAHPHTQAGEVLIHTAFTLTPKGEELLSAWDGEFGRRTEFDEEAHSPVT
ncbi:hypothetical protein ACEUZ9_002841 [Paracoccus litorisediminis]|uniref:hypothetical protein n=1 Tax=Paracoccus litorisediminis TaxID=2006130 RepID=UPI0037309D9B